MGLVNHKWLRIALINLNIIALIGVVLRYKIAFALPFVDQKQLLQGHSHFAFAGWITQALMALLVDYLYRRGNKNAYKKYGWILIANLITAYGMLVVFPISGYNIYSITFSTLSVFVSYIFAIIYWRDLNKLKLDAISHLWFKASLIFNAISSLGAFSLAYMMANNLVQQNWYLSSVYFFLHFQYNGWFFFACMGLFTDKLNTLGKLNGSFKYIFWLFFLACIPAYFLSVLWMPIPLWSYWLVVASAIAQVIAWLWLVKIISIKKNLSRTAFTLLLLSAIALSIKLLLQLGSTYPPLSKLAFGFRPIVIGYLHLILLGVITVFIIGYSVSQKLILLNRLSTVGIIVFTFGIFFNELLLMVQGISALKYESVPYTNEFLLVAAIIMFSGTTLIVRSQFKFKLT
ncbi:MAG: hypothetical protein SGJ10_13115 [Bacteroidota bacterium]|nr:hypothetical protein [Bacteroidota bacterium]